MGFFQGKGCLEPVGEVYFPGLKVHRPDPDAVTQHSLGWEAGRYVSGSGIHGYKTSSANDGKRTVQSDPVN